MPGDGLCRLKTEAPGAHWVCRLGDLVILDLVSDHVRRDAILLSQVAYLIIVGDSPGDLVSEAVSRCQKLGRARAVSSRTTVMAGQLASVERCLGSSTPRHLRSRWAWQGRWPLNQSSKTFLCTEHVGDPMAVGVSRIPVARGRQYSASIGLRRPSGAALQIHRPVSRS